MTAQKKDKQYTALKTLCYAEGKHAKKGDKFTCSDAVYKELKKAKAVE